MRPHESTLVLPREHDNDNNNETNCTCAINNFMHSDLVIND